TLSPPTCTHRRPTCATLFPYTTLVRSMEELGLSPVVLPVTDVLTGLQTGLLDIVAASPVAALVLQWHTKVSYMTDVPVSYSMGLFALDKRAFMRLSESERQIVDEVVTRTVAKPDEAARDDTRRAREVLERSGVKVVHVDERNVESLRGEIGAIFPRIRARADVDAALLDRLVGLLEEYRASHAVAEAEPAN